MAYLLLLGYIELTIDLPEPDTSEIDRIVGTNVFYVDSLSLCLVTTRVRWTPVSRRFHVHATIFENLRVHGHATFNGFFHGHVNDYATFFQKLRVHVTSMTVAWIWTLVSI